MYYTLSCIVSYYCILPHSGVATINNGMATVTVTGLMCEVEYTITAGGVFDGQLVGPRSSHGTITAGRCLVIMTTTTTATTSMISKEEIINLKALTIQNAHMYIRMQ